MSYPVWKGPPRAADMVEATRWLFALLTLVSLPLALLAPLTTANHTLLLVALASAVVLGLTWSAGYLHNSAPLKMDVINAVAILAFALACPEPGATFGFVFSALWFRSLYGSTRQAVLRCCLYVGALSATLPLWPYVPGHTGGTQIGPLAGAFPTMFLTVIVGRHLAVSLQAREQAARRDVVHASAGSQLMGVTDAAEIGRIAWMAVAGICAATPGLRALKVVRDGAALRVDGATCGFGDLPATLPATALLVRGGAGGGGRATAPCPTELDAAAGTPCVWACVPMPEVHNQNGGAWLLLGSPRKVPTEAIAAIGTLASQVTLALTNGEALQKVTLQATLDSLTGLVNRASFNAGLSAALDDKSSRSTTVLFVDLDDFKHVNDVFGHGAGDDLLQEVAARLCQATRTEDLCARLGGDEFAVLLRGTSAVAAAEVAQRIVHAIAALAHIGGGVAQVSASVGVATATSKTDLEQLLHHADVAMYAAKAKGKARIQVFEPGLLQGDSSRVSFERQLAAAASNGELVVHYQPVLSLPDGRCTAAEALVRWRHPEQGLLYPDSFIEVAERIGAIGDIGAYVLRRACADAAAWRDAHPSSPLAIHVNVSALQLDDERFIGSVNRCLGDFSLAPDQLVLEVTETVVISSPVAIDRLNILAAHGVRIAIDDFGTGYSALTTLRSLPAQIVKIDKSFVAGCPENPDDRAVVEAVVKMAAQMGMRTIAEGVESLEQQTFLETIGADAVQGFLYLRPTTAEGFGTWLDGHIDGWSRTRPTSDVVIRFTPRQTA
jgi:diguanylate cyclase (GGDEF)-like protein